MNGKRYPHYLRHTTGGVWPRMVVCLDCKKRSLTDRVRLGILGYQLEAWNATILTLASGGYRVHAHACGTTESIFWEGIAKVCHGHGEVWAYSYRACEQWAMLSGWDRIEEDGSSQLVIDDPPTIIRYRPHGCNGDLVWVDTANYGACPPDGIMDGEATAQWVTSWFLEYHRCCYKYRLGSLRPTVGSQAMHAYKCSYYQGGVYNHVNATATRIETGAYHGGRCEPNRIGSCDRTVFHLDYRSLYPHCVATYGLPSRLRRILPSEDISSLSRRREKYAIIAKVQMQTDDASYPYRRVNDTIYPVGRFTTTLCGPEFWDAVDHGRICEVGDVAEYDQGMILKDYAEAIYRFRCDSEANPVAGISTVAKLMSVTLPGKFGQRNYKWINTPRFHDYRYYGHWDEDVEGGGKQRWRSIAGVVQKDVDMGLAPDSNLAIAGYITSLGRMALLRAIRIALWSNVVYYDTDSVMVYREGYNRLKDAGLVVKGEWGKLQVKNISDNVEIRGVKYYIEQGRVVCAGMPDSRAEKTDSANQYWYHYSVLDAIRHGQQPTSAVHLQEYARGIQCRHRNVHDDGTTTPIRLTEW